MDTGLPCGVEFARNDHEVLMRIAKQRIALTLTLSHPMGEGTAVARPPFSRQSCGKHSGLNFERDGGRFSLSHRMGEGRGEGSRLNL